MCAQVGTYLLGAFGLFVIVTAAAFAYLPWWQALVVSAASGYLIARVLRWLALRTVRRVGSLLEAALALGRGVLRHATVDVHSVRPVLGSSLGPADPAAALSAPVTTVPAYQIELTVFPTGTGPGSAGQQPWDAGSLRVGHADAANPAEYEPTAVEVIENGAASQPRGSLVGAWRLRFTVVLPPDWSACTLRSGDHVLGTIPLRPRAIGG